MASEVTTPRSRRAILAAGLAGLVGAVAGALGRPDPAQAANGGSAILGQTNDATAPTVINNPSEGTVLWANSTATTGVGVGVRGDTAAIGGAGVWGQSNSVGATGVVGLGVGVGISGEGDAGGVLGYSAHDAASVGVQGGSTVGTGVLATATTGTALQVRGKAKFSRSGRASVAKGKAYADITVPGGLTANSVVHATLQTYRSGVAIAAVRTNYPVAGKARIYLTKTASATGSTAVGWFVAEH